jgi:hypothetical protein
MDRGSGAGDSVEVNIDQVIMAPPMRQMAQLKTTNPAATTPKRIFRARREEA